ncbi:MAG: hypothetical protein E6J81_06085 [Deltaproteobacteria bacterium]|nr:MAG: hypothetical protein E6J81_06085 [Deltaproteobacteria bacterium]
MKSWLAVKPWLAAGVVGSAIATSTLNQVINPFTASAWARGTYVILAAALASVAARPLLKRSPITALPLRSQCRWAIASLAIGAVLRLVIPVCPAAWSTRHRLEVVATGERNEAAKATEVWTYGIFDDEGNCLVPPTTLERRGDWSLRGETIVSHGQQPAGLRWEGVLTRDLSLRLLSHPWSGVVEVAWDGRQRRLDLYADSDGIRSVRLPVRRSLSIPDRILLEACTVASLAFSVLVLGAWLVHRRGATVRPAASTWAWAGFAAPCLAVWALYLLVLWPGAMTSDTFDQWAQIITGHYSDWHCFTHTAFLWLVTRPAMSPALGVVVQIVALASVVGWVLARFRHWGMPAPMCWALAAAFALVPGNSLVVVLWKDVPHAIAVVALSMLLLEVVSSGGERLAQTRSLVALGSVAVLVALLRSNAPLAAFGTLALLVVVYPRHWRKLAATLALAVAAWAGLRQGLYPALGVTPAEPKLPWWYVHHIAAHVHARTLLSDEEHTLLVGMAPDIDGELAYTPYHIDATVFDGHFRTAVLRESEPLRKLWWALLERRPMVDLGHSLEASRFVWQVRQPHEMRLNTLPLGPDPEGHVTAIWGADALDRLLSVEDRHRVTPPSTSPKIPVLVAPVSGWLIASGEPRWSWLFWGAPLFLYLAIAGALVCAVRTRTWAYLLVVAPSLLTALGLLVFAVSSEFRFVAPIFMVGMLFGPFLLLIPARADSTL